jgi:CPA2 family monovalent cation:H+ antiporter-2
MACGYIGRCNDSKGKHAPKHYSGVDNLSIKSIEPGESWMFCYADQKGVSM